jgi:branched-chain amino acid transport system permease protein
VRTKSAVKDESVVMAPNAEAPAAPVATPRVDWRQLLRFLPVVLLIIGMAIIGHQSVNSRKWIDLGVEAMYMGAIALGVNILLGYTGLLSLGHAAFFVLGGYAGAIWAVELGMDPWLGFAFAFFIGLVTGAILALMCCHLKGFYLTVVTLAFGLIFPPLAVALKSILGGTTGRAVSRPLNVKHLPWTHGFQGRYVGLYEIACVWMLITLFICWNLIRSRWGRAYQAIRESEVAAKSSGVNTYWYKVSSFALSAAIVATAGAIGAQRFLLVSTANGGQDQSFRYVIVVALGGMGTLAGPIWGGLAITFGFGISWVQNHFSNYITMLFGILGLLGVATAPEGAMGNIHKSVRDFQLKQAKKGKAVRRKPPLEVSEELRKPVPRSLARDVVDDEPVLELMSLTKRFGGLAALSDIDLQVRRKTVHAIIGPNGSGKTTLINVITGYYEATAGGMIFEGRELGELKIHERNKVGIARTFQNLQVWRRMSVIENVMVGAHSRTRVGLTRSVMGTMGSRREERRVRERAWGLLHFVGLADKGYEMAGGLPFADQRRLEIARALASDPELLLLDEPAAGMHPSEIRDLLELIRQIKSTGVTVLLIEHHMDLVMGLSDIVSVLDYGQKIAEGTPEVIKHDQRVIEAYLGAEEVAS